jgi:small-conductance mechanosensitive channel
MLVALLACAVAGLLPARAALPEDRPAVRLGGDDVFTLAAPFGAGGPSERAVLASRRLAEAARDPAVGPEQVAIESRGDILVIRAGAHGIVEVTAADAAAAGTTPAALAADWAARIRAAIGSHKEEAFSLLLIGRWIRRLIYAAAILVFLWVALVAIDRLKLRVLRVPDDAWPALSILGTTAVGVPALRRVALRSISALRILVGLAAAYTLLAVLFAQFPATRAYAWRMVAFVTDLLVTTLEKALEWLPPLIAALIVIVAARLALRFAAVLFARVRRAEPDATRALAPDTAALSEAIVKVTIGLATVALLALVIPGEGGRAMGIALLLILVVVAASLVPAARQIAAGILLAYRRAAPVGSRLEADGVRGTVARTDLLHTVILTDAGEEAWIPHHIVLTRRTLRPAGAATGGGAAGPPAERAGTGSTAAR